MNRFLATYLTIGILLLPMVEAGRECTEWRCPKEDSTWKYVAAAGVGAAAVVAAPFVLPLLGFGAAGVTAGSIAAAVQGPAVASGSLFALLQSAGAAGMAISTKAVIGALGAGATYATASKTMADQGCRCVGWGWGEE